MVHISLGSIPLTLGNTLLWPGCTLIGFLPSALGHPGILAKLHGMVTTSDIYGLEMTGALLEVCQLHMSA